MKEYIVKVGMKKEELEYIKESLFNYNIKSAPPNNESPSKDLQLIAKDIEGQVLGGLIGKIYRSCLFIDILWVNEEFRGSGCGSMLMNRAEEIVREARCKFIHLDTFSFQAPDFYKKNGYEIFGVLDDYPDGIKRYFLKKKI